MEIKRIKSNLNKMVVYKGVKGIYKLTACILRKDESGYFYQAELQDIKSGKSIIYCKLEDLEEQNEIHN